jgi:hypothetical protein
LVIGQSQFTNSLIHQFTNSPLHLGIKIGFQEAGVLILLLFPMNLISKKKIRYRISERLRKYLRQYDRERKIPVQYEDLVQFDNHIAVYDRQGKDTFWITVFYPQSLVAEIHEGLKKAYAILKAGGDLSVMEHLYVDRIDQCLYANTLPFRIRVVNRLNENFDYFYVKQADASRIYGLELEHILSPNRMEYFVHQDTLVEEHIIGIPADQFLKNNLSDRHVEETRLSKEFVKFNERCFIRLLGDMHSGNFVIDITPDFEEIHYRIRPIDFDQQSYERRKSVYLPQYFRQNRVFVELVQKSLTLESIKQYQREERALIFNRLRSSRYQVKELLDVMTREDISRPEHIEALRSELARHYEHEGFHRCRTMGEIVKMSLKVLIRRNAVRS